LLKKIVQKQGGPFYFRTDCLHKFWSYSCLPSICLKGADLYKTMSCFLAIGTI
jgi:hypothetical protein